MTVSAPASADFGHYYTGNNSLDTYAFTFDALTSAELIVELDNVVQGSGYTVSDPFPAIGGSDVVFTTPPGTGVKIAIYRATGSSQGADISNSTTFSESQIEDTLDRLTYLVQDNARKISKSLRIKDGSSGSEFLFPLPVSGDEGKIVVLNSNVPPDGFAYSTSSLGDIDASVSAAAASAAAAAADAVSTAADVVSTAADVVSTNADVVLTAADVVSAAASTALAQQWANEDEDVIVTGAEYSAKHYSFKASDSADLAATTASNLAQTLSGNYISPSNPTVDGDNRFTVVEQMKAYMEASDKAYIPDSGLTVTWHAWLFNGTASSWSSQSCKIESNTYSVEANNTDLGTGLIDIDHSDGAPLYLYYNVAKNKVIVTKYVGV